MNIRDLFNLSQQEQQQFTVDGERINRVEYKKEHNPPYTIWLLSGKYVQAKGHDRLESLNLRAYKTVPGDSRIRQYGEFGSTIN